MYLGLKIEVVVGNSRRNRRKVFPDLFSNSGEQPYTLLLNQYFVNKITHTTSLVEYNIFHAQILGPVPEPEPS